MQNGDDYCLHDASKKEDDNGLSQMLMGTATCGLGVGGLSPSEEGEIMKPIVMRSVLTTLLGVVAVFHISEGILVLAGVCAPPVKYQGTLFTDATLPMLLVAIVVGGAALLAAAMAFIHRARSVFLAAGAGLILIVWEITELVVTHQSSTLQSIFMYASLAIVALAAFLWTTEVRGQSLNSPVVRIGLFVLDACIGVSAIQGGIALLQGALDQWVQVVWLASTPFSDYTVPGLMLVIVVGGSALFAAMTVFVDRKWAALVSMLAGLLMVGYEVVEAVSIDSKVGNGLPTALALQLIFFVAGLAAFGLAGFLWMKEYRGQHFHLKHVSHA